MMMTFNQEDLQSWFYNHSFAFIVLDSGTASVKCSQHESLAREYMDNLSRCDRLEIIIVLYCIAIPICVSKIF